MLDGKGQIIKAEEVFGNVSIDRRRALKAIFGVSSFIGAGVVGASSAGVGLNHMFEHHGFGSVAGFVEKGKLLLPAGTSAVLGPYGNPVLAPAVLHGAPLDKLKPEICNLKALSSALTLKPEVDLKETLANIRVYKVMVQHDNGVCQEFDLSSPNFEPPRISIDEDGLVEISNNFQTIISREDAIHMRLGYFVDRNRFDKGGLIAICSAGRPASAVNPIEFAELETFTLPIREDTLGKRHEVIRSTDIIPAGADFEPGTKFIRSGANLWKYDYSLNSKGMIEFNANCRAHGDRPDSAFDEMGKDIFYRVHSKGGLTDITPEPDLNTALAIQSPGAAPFYATGIVFYSRQADGSIKIDRTNLSKLKKDGGDVHMTATQLLLRDKEGLKNFRILEYRSKPGVDQNTADMYVLDPRTFTSEQLSRIPNYPVRTFIGSYDYLAAAERGRDFLKL